MHKRRNGALALAGIAASTAIVLSGCTTGGTGSDGRTEVVFWQHSWEDYQNEWMQDTVDAYNESQDEVTVSVQFVAIDAWDQKLATAQAAGTQPDITTVPYGRVAVGVAEGRLAPLDEYMSQENFDDIKENVASFVTFDGKHYAYPMFVEPSTVLYYRSDLVEAAGLDPNAPPTTWAELIDWARALTTDDVKGLSIATVAADLAWSSWGLQVNACGHLPISDDWSVAEATDSCYADLAEFYATLYQENVIPQQPKVGYGYSDMYGDGEIAMMTSGSWAIGQIKRQYPELLDKTMVAPFPSIDGDPTKPTSTLGGYTLTVDSKSEHPQEAADFISYLLAGDPELWASYFNLTGYGNYSTLHSIDEVLANDPEANADPFLDTIAEKVVAYGIAEPRYPWEISLAMGTAIEAAMTGSAGPADALKVADDAINDAIEKQQLAGTGN